MRTTTDPRPAGASPGSLVLDTPAAAPEMARRHFLAKLEFETDPADVYADLQQGREGFVLVDTRGPEAFAEGHIAGALNLPSRDITAETTDVLPRDRLVVTYCWGPGCNGSTKGAARLALLGFRVKEMIGGIEYWKREGYPVEQGGSR